MSIKISFPISSEMTVVVSADKVRSIVKKATAGGRADLSDVESRVAEEVLQKMQLARTSWPNESVTASDYDARYKEILKDDAEDRMKNAFDRKEISVEDFVSWCFDRNAGHWPNGTPMCDD